MAGSTRENGFPFKLPDLRVSLAFCILAAAPASVRAQQPPAPSETIRINVARVNVGVTVTDSHGEFVSGLEQKDFGVFDNGAEQTVTGFLPVDEPARVLLLVESGPAALMAHKELLVTASEVLPNLAPADQVAIASYTRTPRMILNFTANKSEAAMALQEIPFMNGFADLNLSSSLLTVLQWLAPLPGKKSVILISSGVDTSQVADWKAIERTLLTSDIRVLAVSTSAELQTAPKHKRQTKDEKASRTFLNEAFQQADASMREISTATGGRVYFPRNAEDFKRDYGEIAQLVRHEYLITYVPPQLDGQMHSIEVKVRRHGVMVDYRRAYIAPPAN